MSDSTASDARAELRFRLRTLAVALSAAGRPEELIPLVWQAKSAALKVGINGVSAYSALRSLYQDLQEGRPIDYVEVVALLTSQADRL